MSAKSRVSRPEQVAQRIEAAGWEVTRAKQGPFRRITARRGEEVIELEFVRTSLRPVRDVFVPPEANASPWCSSVAEALRHIERAPDVPFTLDSPDEAVLAAVAGKTVHWRNSISGRDEHADVPRCGLHLKLAHPSIPGYESGERILNFPSPAGFRAVRLDAIRKVV